MNFESFFKELTSEEQWFENVSLRHKPETFKTVCKLVWTLALADANQMKVTPMSEHRRHVVYKLSKILPDKDNSKQWFQLEAEKKEAEEKKEWVPLTGEARAKKLAEFKAMVDAAPKAFTTPKMSAQEIANEGDWLPKKEKPFVRSEFENQLAYKEHIDKVNTARKKLFLSKFPDASEEEIEAYLLKFKSI